MRSAVWDAPGSGLVINIRFKSAAFAKENQTGNVRRAGTAM
jgi:hypothetical protein